MDCCSKLLHCSPGWLLKDVVIGVLGELRTCWNKLRWCRLSQQHEQNRKISKLLDNSFHETRHIWTLFFLKKKILPRQTPGQGFKLKTEIENLASFHQGSLLENPEEFHPAGGWRDCTGVLAIPSCWNTFLPGEWKNLLGLCWSSSGLKLRCLFDLRLLFLYHPAQIK